MTVKTTFIAHAEQDRDFAARLADFLEQGCNILCSPEEGTVRPGESLVDKAEFGLSADIIVLLLSEHSWPRRLSRETWERVLFDEAADAKVEVTALLLGECPYPPLLRRRGFFDATSDRQTAMRLLKRWIWQWEKGATHSLNTSFSPELEDLYQLADRSGTLCADGAPAARFAREASQDFEEVLWVPCHGRSLAQVAGDLGSQLDLVLDGDLADNCRRICELLEEHRCLLVLDAPRDEHLRDLAPSRRTSVLITRQPVKTVETPHTLVYARKLIEKRRYAEAYELLHSLLDSDTSPSDCARELTWICEHWNRGDESESLRSYYRLPPEEQLALF